MQDNFDLHLLHIIISIRKLGEISDETALNYKFKFTWWIVSLFSNTLQHSCL